jgi:hypothetical protein
MAEGTTNEDGIYVYTEDDRTGLISTLLNKLGSSVSVVVRSLRNRIRQIEENLPAPLAAGRFDTSIKSMPSHVVTRLPLLLMNFDESSTVAPTLWAALTGTSAGSIRFKKSGMYQVSIRVEATVELDGRVFLNLAGQRVGTTLEVEHKTTLAATLVITADDEVVSFEAYHTTGASREVAFHITIIRLGDFG